MLTLSGTRQRPMCDGVSRRGFLQVGGLALGGLTLPNLLRLQAAAGQAGSRPKAVIMLYLAGGPPHMDMYDMKPEAPAEVRGEFRPIHTNVPGIDICEHLPLQATIADKLTIIRNMRFYEQQHQATELLSGAPGILLAPDGQPIQQIRRPDFGAVVSHVKPNNTSMPSYVAVGGPLGGTSGAAFLGAAHQPFYPYGPGVENMGLASGLTLQKLENRKELLRSLDTIRRDIDAKREMAGMDQLTGKALDIIASPQVRAAFDVSREPESVRQKYGKHPEFLLARRLAEAGAAFVTVYLGTGGTTWDTHEKKFPTLRNLLPFLDQMVYAIVTDLHERGLEQDIVLMVAGEMGRTTQINKSGGRDHYWDAGFCLLAGGGFKTGQAIGNTGPRAERDVNSHYTPQNVLATLYKLFGIDPATTLTDHSGRPHFVLDERKAISEL